MIPSFVKVPVSLAQQIALGVLRLGVGGASALLHRVLPSGDSAPEGHSAPPKPSAAASAEPVSPPTPPAKKAPAKKAPAKKAPAKKAKPAAVLDEPVAPVDDDPVVYSSGPEVAETLPPEDLEALRAELD